MPALRNCTPTDMPFPEVGRASTATVVEALTLSVATEARVAVSDAPGRGGAATPAPPSVEKYCGAESVYSPPVGAEPQLAVPALAKSS